MTIKTLMLSVAVAALGAMPHLVCAQTLFNKPAAAITYRQGAFHVMGAHAQRLGSMAKGDKPFDKTQAENDAQVIEILSRQLDSAFPAGSDSAPSKAKPEIWQDAAGFKQKMEDLKNAAGKLNTAARSGDINLFKAAYNSTAQTCKACHDGFRNR